MWRMLFDRSYGFRGQGRRLGFQPDLADWNPVTEFQHLHDVRSELASFADFVKFHVVRRWLDVYLSWEPVHRVCFCIHQVSIVIRLLNS